MRLAGGLLLAGSVGVLAACSADPGGNAADAGDPIECALAGATAFARDCRLERVEQDGVKSLVVRHADGGFRRFEQRPDGSLALVDGAAWTRVQTGGVGEIAVGKDRYRIPTGTASHAP